MTNRSVRFAVVSALGLALGAFSGTALAQDPPTTPTEGAPAATEPPPAGGEGAVAPAPTASTSGAPLLTLRQGGIRIDGDIVIGMSSGSAGKPIQIVPNVYYGVNDQLTVGLAHNPGAEIFQTNGRGLCLSGESNGCAKVYNNLSLDALYSFMRSSTMDLAVHGGLDFIFLDPLWLSLRAGVKGKALAGPLEIVFDPSINVGVTDRSAGNKELLQIPVRLGFYAMPQLNLGVSTGVFGALDGFGDNYVIPLGFGGVFGVNSQLSLRAQFTLDRIAAASGSGADFRTLSLGAAFAL
jgi:hypothetical protein